MNAESMALAAGVQAGVLTAGSMDIGRGATGGAFAIGARAWAPVCPGVARLSVVPFFTGLTRLATAVRARACATELRIDVTHAADSVEDELREMQDRFAQRLRAQCTRLPFGFDGLRFWHREADGEHYVYVESTSDSALVGYAVLNRLVELSRALDPHVRSPHTRIAPAFQGRGIATAIYRWALDSGLCLVSGARQSQGARALWSSLGRRYHLTYVQLVDKELRLLGPRAPAKLRDALQTRLMLFGVDAGA